MQSFLALAMIVVTMLAALTARTAVAQPGSGSGANALAVGPRGSVGPDVPLSDAENKQFAERLTVTERSAAGVQAACERAIKAGF